MRDVLDLSEALPLAAQLPEPARLAQQSFLGGSGGRGLWSLGKLKTTSGRQSFKLETSRRRLPLPLRPPLRPLQGSRWPAVAMKKLLLQPVRLA